MTLEVVSNLYYTNALFCLQRDEECIGFATLPDQIHRKVIKKGFHFTIMVVGKFIYIHA